MEEETTNPSTTRLANKDSLIAISETNKGTFVHKNRSLRRTFLKHNLVADD